MTAVFSSPQATAIANLLVFAGVILGAVKLGKIWWTRFATRFSRLSRQVRQKQIVDDLCKIRIYRENKIAAVRDAAYAVFDDLLSNIIVIVSVLALSYVYVSIDHSSKTLNDDSGIWKSVFDDHVYWYTISTMVFVLVTALAVAFLFGTRRCLRFLTYASDPDQSRKKLIEQYLKLRSFR